MDQKPWTRTHTYIRMLVGVAGETYKPLVEGDKGDEGAVRFVAVYLPQWGAHLLSESRPERVVWGGGGGHRWRWGERQRGENTDWAGTTQMDKPEGYLVELLLLLPLQFLNCCCFISSSLSSL